MPDTAPDSPSADPVVTVHDEPAPAPEPPAPPPPPPTLAQLADATEAARTAYKGAKQKAAESDAQAKADATARETAHSALRSAIFELDVAAKAEDPDPT
jgi:hypothetical protein